MSKKLGKIRGGTFGSRNPFVEEGEAGRQNLERLADFLEIYPETGDLPELFRPEENALMEATARRLTEAVDETIKARDERLLADPRYDSREAFEKLVTHGVKFAEAVDDLPPGGINRMAKTMEKSEDEWDEYRFTWFLEFVEQHGLQSKQVRLRSILSSILEEGTEGSGVVETLREQFLELAPEFLSDLVLKVVALAAMTLDELERPNARLPKKDLDEKFVQDIASVLEKAFLLRFTRWPWIFIDDENLDFAVPVSFSWCHFKSEVPDEWNALSEQKVEEYRNECYAVFEGRWREMAQNDFKDAVRFAYQCINDFLPAVESTGSLFPDPLVGRSSFDRYLASYDVCDPPRPGEFDADATWEAFVEPNKCHEWQFREADEDETIAWLRERPHLTPVFDLPALFGNRDD